MVDCKKRQEKGFEGLKDILQEKGTTEKIQEYLKRIDSIFAWYIIMDLNWEVVLRKSQELDGDELEKFLLQVVELVESYDEGVL